MFTDNMSNFDSDFDKSWKRSMRKTIIIGVALFFLGAVCFMAVMPKLVNTGTLATQGVFKQGDAVIINGQDTGKVVNTMPDFSINGLSYVISYRDKFGTWHKQNFRQVELVKVGGKK